MINERNKDEAIFDSDLNKETPNVDFDFGSNVTIFEVRYHYISRFSSSCDFPRKYMA